MYYGDVFSALNEAGVRYLVAGGLALNLHGVPRMTADLDLMADPAKSNLEKLIMTMKNLGYKPAVPVKLEDFLDEDLRKQWSIEKNMVVFSLFHPSQPFQEIDIFLFNPIDFEDAHRNKAAINAGGLLIPVLSISHLIESKQLAARQQDMADIESLKKLKNLLEEER